MSPFAALVACCLNVSVILPKIDEHFACLAVYVILAGLAVDLQQDHVPYAGIVDFSK
jgi:hypothetical protein